MYYKVAEQISKENAYSFIDRKNQGDFILYSITKFQHGEIHFKVTFSSLNKEFKSTCILFETDGYPCRHIWAVMKHLDIRSQDHSSYHGGVRMQRLLFATSAPIKQTISKTTGRDISVRLPQLICKLDELLRFKGRKLIQAS